MNTSETISKLNQSRQALLQAIDGLSAAKMISEPAEGIWTIKDLLAHVQSWDSTVMPALRECARGGAFAPQVIADHLAWNDQQAPLWQSKSLPEIQQEMQATRQEMIALIEKLTPEQLQAVCTAPWGEEGTLAQILSGLAWHENHHVASILKVK